MQQIGLSERFDSAMQFAHRIHRDQKRKGTDIPYIAHVIGVTGIVLEYGGTETQAIAALLHDTIEDAPETLGAETVRRWIKHEFGTAVLNIVEHCTDASTKPKPPWLERKKAYIAAAEHAPEDALLVSAADKMHNARAILRDYRTHREQLWARFNKDAGQAGTLGYYRALADIFARRLRNPIVEEIEQVLSALEAQTGGPQPWPPVAK